MEDNVLGLCPLAFRYCKQPECRNDVPTLAIVKENDEDLYQDWWRTLQCPTCSTKWFVCVRCTRVCAPMSTIKAFHRHHRETHEKKSNVKRKFYNSVGACPICMGLGPVGLHCSACEDSGMIYTSDYFTADDHDTTLEDAELTGDVILNRSVNEEAKIVQEALTSLKLPAIKPNEKITVDLGKFTISKVKWHCRSFDETLEEWKVVCSKGEANIGEKISTDKYGYLLRGIQKEKEKQVDGKKGR